MSIVVDCLIDLGMDAGKEYLKDKKNELLLKNEIYSYINEQSNINEICTLEEEIDFQGIVNYLRSNLLCDVKRYLFGKYNERNSVKEKILCMAYEHSKACNVKQKKRVEKIVDGVLDILCSFYRSQIYRNDLFLASEAIGTIIEQMEKQNDKITSNILNGVETIIKTENQKVINVLNGNEQNASNTIRTNSLFQRLHNFIMKKYIKERYREAELSGQDINLYSEMFKLFVDINNGDNIVQVNKNIFDYVREDILTQKRGNLIKIVGPDGTGKSTFLSILYIYLYKYCLNNGFTFYPFYINLHYYD